MKRLIHVDKVLCPGVCTIETSTGNTAIIDAANAQRGRVTAIIQHFEDGVTRIFCPRLQVTGQRSNEIRHCTAITEIAPEEVTKIVRESLASGFAEAYFQRTDDESTKTIDILKRRIYTSDKDADERFDEEEEGLTLIPGDCPYEVKK